jgi:hypothetical protein
MGFAAVVWSDWTTVDRKTIERIPPLRDGMTNKAEQATTKYGDSSLRSE